MRNSFFIISAIIFVIFSFLGYCYALFFPQEVEEIITNFTEDFSFVSELNNLELFFLIFLNNSIKTFLAMILGVFLGIIPLLFLFVNGFFLGISFSFFSEVYGYSTVLLGILPHGVLEIPAAVIASSYGLFLGWSLIKREKIPIKESVFSYLKIVLPLMFLAALIEVYIVPYFL